MYMCQVCKKSTERGKTMLRIIEWKPPSANPDEKPKKDIAREIPVCPACFAEHEAKEKTV